LKNRCFKGANGELAPLNATQSGDEDKQSVAREKYDIAVSRMDELQKQKSSNTAGVAEMRYSLFDLSLENAAKPEPGTQKDFHDRMGAYNSLMQGVQSRAGMAQGQQIESDYEAAQRELFAKQRECRIRCRSSQRNSKRGLWQKS